MPFWKQRVFTPTLNKHVGEKLESAKDTENGGVSTKRRGRLDIIAEILDAAMNGTVKTRIMYNANVNFVQFNYYFEYLLEARLIGTIVHRGKTIYRTTEKGKFLLQRFKEAAEMLNERSDKVDREKCNKPLIFKKGPMVYLIKK